MAYRDGDKGAAQILAPVVADRDTRLVIVQQVEERVKVLQQRLLYGSEYLTNRGGQRKKITRQKKSAYRGAIADATRGAVNAEQASAPVAIALDGHADEVTRLDHATLLLQTRAHQLRNDARTRMHTLIGMRTIVLITSKQVHKHKHVHEAKKESAHTSPAFLLDGAAEVVKPVVNET